MRVVDVARDGYATAAQAVKRSTLQQNPKVEAIVADIVADVRARGDAALTELGRRFDCPTLADLEVSAEEWDRAIAEVDPDTRSAVEAAAANIDAFHQRQRRGSWQMESEGAVTGQILRALDIVGVYVPGGTAAYPSTVLMCAIPARVAGVREIVMCTPCRKDGTLLPTLLYAAKLAGVHRVFKTGGAQAIAAMAYGTQTVPRVDKVVGPGNVYVNVAKRQLYGIVDIDMLAGPSEVCVVADENANPAFAAADMLAQAEHDVECAAYLITPSRSLADAVSRELEQRVARLPRRGILQQALDAHAVLIVTESLQQAFDIANECAPEHLALMVRDPFAHIASIRNAGAILVGDYAPQTLGDYLAGPSHTLPTSGTARFASPLNVDTFLKKSSFIYYSREALEHVASTLTHLATVEGFEAHADAVRARTGDREPR